VILVPKRLWWILFDSQYSRKASSLSDNMQQI
jgi:hypothetical protein